MIRNYPADYYLGKFDACFCGYAQDPNVRLKAASGGLTTELISYMLDNGKIDAAYVSRLRIHDGQFSIEKRFVDKSADLRSFQSSIYMDFPFQEVKRDIENYQGRVAVVGLPCHLAHIQKKDIIKIGLFCGHGSTVELIRRVLSRKCDLKEIAEFYFRQGHWRGESVVILKNGKILKFPYLSFGVLQNIFFHVPARCLYCKDHAAECSDVSFGDLWLRAFKKEKIKHSCVISRNKAMTGILWEMYQGKRINLNRIEPERIVRSQKRSLIFHKFVTGAIKQIQLGNHAPGCNWNDYFSARFILLNKRLSESVYSDIFFVLPWQVVFIYMGFVRIFLSF